MGPICLLFIVSVAVLLSVMFVMPCVAFLLFCDHVTAGEDVGGVRIPPPPVSACGDAVCVRRRRYVPVEWWICSHVEVCA